MKKIISTILSVFLMLVSITSASAAIVLINSTITSASDDSFDIQVKHNGDGVVSYFSDDKTVTFTCIETSEKFVFWNIQGKYDIVKGDYNDKYFTVKPLSNITAIAVFESGVKNRVSISPATVDMISPKTGDDRLWSAIFAFVLGAASALICRYFAKRMVDE